MEEDNFFLQQAEKNINILLIEKKYQEAYVLCNKIIAKYPNYKVFEKLKKKIEDSVEKENEEVVKKSIEALEPLWEEQKYAEILIKLKHLTKLDPDSWSLQRMYKKAQTLYMEQIEELKKKFKKEKTEKLNKLLEEDPESLLRELNLLEQTNARDPEIIQFLNGFRSELIKKRIADKGDLLSSDKYDAIFNFIETLKKIDASSPEIEHLQKKIQFKKAESQLDAKKEFIYKEKEYITTLIQLNKYDKAIQAIEELAKYGPLDDKLKALLNEAKGKFFSQSKNDTIKSIDQNSPNLKKEYESNKDNFVKF